MKTVKIVSLIIALVIITSLAVSCGNVDPNVDQGKNGETAVGTDASSEDSTAPEEDGNEVTAIGGGRDGVKEIDGVSVDVGAFARRSYELCFLLGQTSFNSVDEMSPDAAVQFAFCHLYYEELWQMPVGVDVYRTATVEEISKKLEEYFGANKIDPSKSVLYTASLKKLEMYQPKYGVGVFYNVDSFEKTSDDGVYEIITTFFTGKSKTDVIGRTTMQIKIVEDRAIIVAMTSEIK
ncbi:MAG: hypothetical protein IKN38_10735 [Clostridia bacterium]|nr:hypothetical protein [Clostridia bacterium]